MRKVFAVLLFALVGACSPEHLLPVGGDGGTAGTAGIGGAGGFGGAGGDAPVYSCACSNGNLPGAPAYGRECEVEWAYCDLPSPCPTVWLIDDSLNPPPAFQSIDTARCVAEALRDRTLGMYLFETIHDTANFNDGAGIHLFAQDFAVGSSSSQMDLMSGSTVYGRHRVRPPSHFDGCLGLENDHEAMMWCLRDWQLACELEPIVCPDRTP